MKNPSPLAIIGFAALVIGMMYFWIMRRQPDHVAIAPTPPPALPGAPVPTMPAQPPASAPPAAAPPATTAPDKGLTQIEVERLRSSAPTQDGVRKEVRDNPHVTPPSLVAFARMLGPLMEKGLGDPASAQTLAKELQACAWNEKLAASARALCLSNTERLAEAHPGLTDEAEETRERSPADVVRLAEASRGLR